MAQHDDRGKTGAGNVVSLSRHRKARARAERQAEADANAIRFGRTRAERLREVAEAKRAQRRIEAHRRDPAVPERSGDDPAEDGPR